MNNPPNYVYHSDRDPWLAVEQAYMRKTGINAAPLRIRDMDGPRLADFLNEHFPHMWAVKAPAWSWDSVPASAIRERLEYFGYLPFSTGPLIGLVSP